jgi:hypothetical protein
MESLKRVASILTIAAVLAPTFASAEEAQTVPASCVTALMANVHQEYAPAPVVRDSRSYGFSPLEFLDLSGPTTKWTLTATNPRNSQTVAHLSCTVLNRTGEIIELGK